MKNTWVVYLEENNYGGSISIIGITCDIQKFKEIAKEKFGIYSEPIFDYYGKGSVHYEYTVKKAENYSEYYSLIAEPTITI